MCTGVVKYGAIVGQQVQSGMVTAVPNAAFNWYWNIMECSSGSRANSNEKGKMSHCAVF